jgi:hypothetical protein
MRVGFWRNKMCASDSSYSLLEKRIQRLELMQNYLSQSRLDAMNDFACAGKVWKKNPAPKNLYANDRHILKCNLDVTVSSKTKLAVAHSEHNQVNSDYRYIHGETHLPEIQYLEWDNFINVEKDVEMIINNIGALPEFRNMYLMIVHPQSNVAALTNPYASSIQIASSQVGTLFNRLLPAGGLDESEEFKRGKFI